MKTKRFVLTLLSAATLLGLASASFAQGNGNGNANSNGNGNGNSQAGGLPALAAQVAALRAMVEDLQEQIGSNEYPYTGTYAVTLVESAVFGCRAGPNSGPPPNYIPQYFLPVANSSISVRSAAFEAEANGTILDIPPFAMLTRELTLSGKYLTDTETEGDAQIVIAGNGSFSAQVDHSHIQGQFSDDGSMFTALVTGHEPPAVPGGCDDAWAVHMTGVRK